MFCLDFTSKTKLIKICFPLIFPWALLGLIPFRSKILIIISFNFSVSDFTHALSKAHEQHAEDLSNLVEDFRTKNVELLRDR